MAKPVAQPCPTAGCSGTARSTGRADQIPRRRKRVRRPRSSPTCTARVRRGVVGAGFDSPVGRASPTAGFSTSSRSICIDLRVWSHATLHQCVSGRFVRGRARGAVQNGFHLGRRVRRLPLPPAGARGGQGAGGLRCESLKTSDAPRSLLFVHPSDTRATCELSPARAHHSAPAHVAQASSGRSRTSRVRPATCTRSG